jgi:hypothetical protein
MVPGAERRCAPAQSWDSQESVAGMAKERLPCGPRLRIVLLWKRSWPIATAPDGDTFLVTLSPHRSDAPELDQTFWWRG